MIKSNYNSFGAKIGTKMKVARIKLNAMTAIASSHQPIHPSTALLPVHPPNITSAMPSFSSLPTLLDALILREENRTGGLYGVGKFART